MPTLKDLSCTIKWSNDDEPLPEYTKLYSDGRVDCHLAVPDNPPAFFINLTSSAYIAPGLSMFVYMDGAYQCNRNRVDLGEPSSASDVDFKIRQQEEWRPDGTLWGKAWRFRKLGEETQAKQLIPAPLEGSHVGCIEVVVLRCASRPKTPFPETVFRLPVDFWRDPGRAYAVQHKWMMGMDGTADDHERDKHHRHKSEQRRGSHNCRKSAKSNHCAGEHVCCSASAPKDPAKSMDGHNSNENIRGHIKRSSSSSSSRAKPYIVKDSSKSYGKLHRQRTPSKLKLSMLSSDAPDGLKSEAHWSQWQKQEVLQPRPLSYRPQELTSDPPLKIPKEVVEQNMVSHEVAKAKPVPYMHQLSRPQYLDTFEKPYAVFSFKYRDAGIIERELGIRILDEQSKLELEYQGLSHDELVRYLAKLTLEGHKAGVPLPRLKKMETCRVEEWQSQQQGSRPAGMGSRKTTPSSCKVYEYQNKDGWGGSELGEQKSRKGSVMSQGSQRSCHHDHDCRAHESGSWGKSQHGSQSGGKAASNKDANAINDDWGAGGWDKSQRGSQGGGKAASNKGANANNDDWGAGPSGGPGTSNTGRQAGEEVFQKVKETKEWKDSFKTPKWSCEAPEPSPVSPKNVTRINVIGPSPIKWEQEGILDNRESSQGSASSSKSKVHYDKKTNSWLWLPVETETKSPKDTTQNWGGEDTKGWNEDDNAGEGSSKHAATKEGHSSSHKRRQMSDPFADDFPSMREASRQTSLPDIREYPRAEAEAEKYAQELKRELSSRRTSSGGHSGKSARNNSDKGKRAVSGDSLEVPTSGKSWDASFKGGAAKHTYRLNSRTSSENSQRSAGKPSSPDDGPQMSPVGDLSGNSWSKPEKRPSRKASENLNTSWDDNDDDDDNNDPNVHCSKGPSETSRANSMKSGGIPGGFPVETEWIEDDNVQSGGDFQTTDNAFGGDQVNDACETSPVW